MRLEKPPALALALGLSMLPPSLQAQSTSQAEAPAAKVERLPPESPESGDFWRLMASPYTVHYHKDNEGEHEPVYMIGLERQRSDGWVWGGVYFSNSFGQPSTYVYVGQRYAGFSRWQPLFVQWTAGIMYGYKEPYEDKVPFNVNGFSPGVTVGLGWQFTREFSMQGILLGTAGLMLQLAYDLR